MQATASLDWRDLEEVWMKTEPSRDGAHDSGARVTRQQSRSRGEWITNGKMTINTADTAPANTRREKSQKLRRQEPAHIFHVVRF